MEQSSEAIEYAEHRPRGVLAGLVERLWTVRSPTYPYRRETILPDGAVEIMFTLGPTHGLADRPTGTVARYDDAWVAGQRRGPILVEAESGYDLVGVRLFPHGATALVDVPQHELAGHVVELGTWWARNDIQNLREQLAEARTVADRLPILEEALSVRASRGRAVPPLVHAGVAALCRDRTDLTIGALAEGLGVSHRRLIESFERYVGLKPKELQRVMRFQRAIAMEDRFPSRPWAAVATACGYSDQAHLINEFRSFSGMTPERYRQGRAEYPNYVPEPGPGPS